MQTVGQLWDNSSSQSPQNQTVGSLWNSTANNAPQFAGQLWTNPDILPVSTQVTQRFGNDNPDVEVFSGGTALDTNFTADPGTQINTPKGQWVVSQIYNQANPTAGYVGNSQGQGWGNYATITNVETGEKLQFSHLSSVNVQPNQLLLPGMALGTTGNSGNSTGPNLGVSYWNPEGEQQDVLDSPYGQDFNIQQ